jgi:hypothetical protein
MAVLGIVVICALLIIAGILSKIGSALFFGSETAAKRSAIAAKCGPRTVELAGEKIPTLVGEVDPESGAGRLQIALKRLGIWAARFEAMESAQQTAAKNVIRKAAEQTSGFIGPLNEEPSAALKCAADAVSEKAKLMCEALDRSLAKMPSELNSVAIAITNRAIVQAKVVNGYLYLDEDDLSELKAKAEKQPLTSFFKVTSDLWEIRSTTSEAYARSNICEVIESMNVDMDRTMNDALKGTVLYDSWKEVENLLSRGYALRDVEVVLFATTKGAYRTEQREGYEYIPTLILAPSLVESLKELEGDGTLDRAFSPHEKTNLWQVADILYRAQKVPSDRLAESLYRYKDFDVGAELSQLRRDALNACW